MAHYRRAVGTAVILNTAVSGVEAVAGFQAGSLSLLMDSAHNLSDEMALVALWLAFFVSRGPSQALLRSANVFNSLGLIIISGALLWQAVERVLYPVPVPGLIPALVGSAAALGNYAVALLLKEAGERNASIRLAYVHNLGDVWVSLAPVAAGALLILTGYSLFDRLVAGAIAIWLIVTTALAVLNAHDELIWPENIACCHTEPGAIAHS